MNRLNMNSRMEVYSAKLRFKLDLSSMIFSHLYFFLGKGAPWRRGGLYTAQSTTVIITLQLWTTAILKS